MFYVYALTDPRNSDRFFYIGKGTKSRAQHHLRRSTNSENNSKQATVKAIRNDGFEPGVIKLFENLTEQEALDKEIELIALYGRKDLGLGHLTNLTNGGEGTSGHKHTEETKKKMREAVRPNKGKKLRTPRTPEHTAKVAKSRIGKPSPIKGTTWTDEQKANLSKLRKGSKCPTKGKKRVYRKEFIEKTVVFILRNLQ
jgi:hypothetical protein